MIDVELPTIVFNRNTSKTMRQTLYLIPYTLYPLFILNERSRI
jgi:hypothetical protein